MIKFITTITSITIIILNIYFYIFFILGKSQEIRSLKQDNMSLTQQLLQSEYDFYLLLKEINIEKEKEKEKTAYKIHIYDYTGKPYFKNGHIIIEQTEFSKTNLFREISQMVKSANKDRECHFAIHYLPKK